MSMITTEPLSFGNSSDARDFLTTHFAAWPGSLTAEELDALRDYKGTGYRDLNEGLREGWIDEFDGTVELLDSAIAKAQLQVPVVAFRGFADYGIGDALDYMVGATIDEDHFSSTSLVSLTAEGFLHDAADDEDAVLGRFILPGGLNVAPLDLIEDLGESELLLPRGTAFYVASVEDGGDFPVMNLRWRP